jgi:hypothetical protein
MQLLVDRPEEAFIEVANLSRVGRVAMYKLVIICHMLVHVYTKYIYHLQESTEAFLFFYPGDFERLRCGR